MRIQNHKCKEAPLDNNFPVTAGHARDVPKRLSKHTGSQYAPTAWQVARVAFDADNPLTRIRLGLDDENFNVGEAYKRAAEAIERN